MCSIGMRDRASPRIAVALALALVFMAEARAKYGGGSGTAEDPYQIWTAEQMNEIGLEPKDFGKHFKLMADIDLAPYTEDRFNLIGYFDGNSERRGIYSFWGVFDGNGHTISNLTYIVTQPDPRDPAPDWLHAYGLFRYLNGEVRDLGIIDPAIRPAPACTYRVGQIGALVGYCLTGSISNCYVQGGHVSGDETVGGLVGVLGTLSDPATVSDCHASCTVSCSLREHQVGPSGAVSVVFGGLVGDCWGTIVRSYAQGKVAAAEADGDVGELVGALPSSASKAAIQDSYSTGPVSGKTYVGGLVGSCRAGRTITNCFATGSVLAVEEAGGLVGHNEGDLSWCYSTALVSATSDEVGGLVGRNDGTILASWAGGNVTGGVGVGGLVGLNRPVPLRYDRVVQDCYARGNVRGRNRVAGLIGDNQQGRAVWRCYSTGRVRGETASSAVSGLVCTRDATLVKASFWDIETSGLSTSEGGQGKTTAEIQRVWTYMAAGWDFAGERFNGTDDVWKMCCGRPIYPKLSWEQMLVGDFVDPEGVGPEDLVFLAQHWLQTTAFPCDSPDLNFDGHVDTNDFALLAPYWGQGARETIFETRLDTPAAWTAEGQWQFGVPAGQGGTLEGHPDPTGGYTGAHVYGVNLGGDYAVAADGPHYLTAGPFDCELYRGVTLQFARWLNTDEADYVRAAVEISTDGTVWTVVWEHEDAEVALADETWQVVTCNLSPMADHQKSVYIRWGYEVLDEGAWAMSGWNIDDIVLTGN